jgi:Domain of unknown function (DUF756)
LPGTPLADGAKTGTEIRLLDRGPEALLSDFSEDVRNGRLPQAQRLYVPGTTLSLGPGQTRTQRWPLSRTRGWYDLVITVAGDLHFEYRYAGHLENG